MRRDVTFAAAVEGIVDEAVLTRVTTEAGGVLYPVHGKRGKDDLRQRIRGFNHAAQYAPWIVLVDLNSSASCPAELRQKWLPTPARMMNFRVAVHQIEAWLLADSERLASFLGVALSLIPVAPELEQNAKEVMVNLARRSSHRDVRADMVPTPSSGRAVGPAYSSRLIEFASELRGWRPKVAAERSSSLARCIRCLHAAVAQK